MRPVFATARLLIRPRAAGDTDACLAMDRDREVTRFVEVRIRGPSTGLGYWTVTDRHAPATLRAHNGVRGLSGAN